MPKFSKLCLFPDVNVWLALTWEGHERHQVARKWFQGLNAADRLGFCRFTQISLLRLLTTRAVMNDDTMTPAEAWSAYDRWFHDDRWADAYLAAFANSEEMRLVTFDRALGGSVDHPFLLEP
jgi:predicted nucleic acid-binding protein